MFLSFGSHFRWRFRTCRLHYKIDYDKAPGSWTSQPPRLGNVRKRQNRSESRRISGEKLSNQQNWTQQTLQGSSPMTKGNFLVNYKLKHPDVVDPRSEIKTSEDTEMESMRTKEKRHYEEAVRFAAQLSERHNRKLDGIASQDGGWAVRPKASTSGWDSLCGAGFRRSDDGSHWKQAVSLRRRRTSWRLREKLLVPWCENDAWRPVKRTQAPNGTIVPMRFSSTLQGGQAERPSHPAGFQASRCGARKVGYRVPTLSRLGKYLIVLVGCIKRWKFGTMDVKSAFLQSDYIHHKVELYGRTVCWHEETS